MIMAAAHSPLSIPTPLIGIRTIQRNHIEPVKNQGGAWIVNQIILAIAKAVLVTLVSTLAAIAVEKIRYYNDDRNERVWNQPGDNEYEHWQ
jgi:hypothetical protein